MISVEIILCHTCPVKKILLFHLVMKTSFLTMAVLPLTFKRNAMNQYFWILKTHKVGDPGRELGFDSLLDLSPLKLMFQYIRISFALPYGLGDNEFFLSGPSLLPMMWM